MTFDINVDHRPLDRLARKIGDIEELVEDEMVSTMWASVSAIEQNVLNIYDEKDINYNGDLKAAINKEVYGNPVDGLTGEVNTGNIAYAEVVEFGRLPGKPVSMAGQAALDLWSQRKGPGVPGYVLARSITKKGILPGRYFMRDGFARARSQVEKLWAGIADRVAKRFEAEA